MKANNSLYEEINTLSEKNTLINYELDNIKAQLDAIIAPDAKAPEWLDQTKQAYSPPVRYVNTDGKPFTISIKQQDIYAPSKSLEDLVKNEAWMLMTHNKKLMSIWHFVTSYLRYAYDFGDAWQYPATTYYRKWGDCEDGTVLFLTLCKLAKVPCDKVFNACGYFNDGSTQFGHSYPVAQMEDDLWYVFETTINDKPANPKRWKDSPYYADWGLANHVYQGKIKNGKQI